jgi:hypothetical protein
VSSPTTSSSRPERELDVEPILERPEPEVVEPAQLVAREGLRFELGERPPTPQGQRRTQPLRPQLHLHGLACFGQESFEPHDVDGVLLELEPVARRLRDQPLRSEQLAQMRHVPLQGGRRGSRRALGPQCFQ